MSSPGARIIQLTSNAPGSVIASGVRLGACLWRLGRWLLTRTDQPDRQHDGRASHGLFTCHGILPGLRSKAPPTALIKDKTVTPGIGVICQHPPSGALASQGAVVLGTPIPSAAPPRGHQQILRRFAWRCRRRTPSMIRASPVKQGPGRTPSVRP